MTDAAGAAQGMRSEVETAARSQAERFFRSMDLPQREEFEAVKAMALKAREENEKLAKRVAELEAALGRTQAPRPAILSSAQSFANPSATLPPLLSARSRFPRERLRIDCANPADHFIAS